MYAQSITNVFIWFRAYIKFLIHFRLDECRIESVLHGGASPTLRRGHLHLRHTLSQRLSICSWVCEQYFRVTARHVWLWWRTSGSLRRPWRKHKKLVFYVCGAGCFSVPLSLHKQKCKKQKKTNINQRWLIWFIIPLHQAATSINTISTQQNDVHV